MPRNEITSIKSGRTKGRSKNKQEGSTKTKPKKNEGKPTTKMAATPKSLKRLRTESRWKSKE